MAAYYQELLKICGFEGEEIDRERSRIEKAFERFEIGPDDMPAAENWVMQNHDVQLLGVRRLLGAWLKELIDLVLAKDEGKKVGLLWLPHDPGTWHVHKGRRARKDLQRLSGCGAVSHDGTNFQQAHANS